ncbi:MAG: leucine-rich repeat domain-containing protein, partial [Oscillospiraceae bacterium]
GCKMLAAVEIPASVVAIGESAFEDCGGLTSLTFEKDSQLGTINRRAFLGCGKLTTLTLPARLSNIGGSAFFGCTALTSVEFTRKQAPTMGADVFSLFGATSGVTLTVPLDGKGYAEDSWATNGYTKQFPADQQANTPPAAPTKIAFSFDKENAGKLMGTTTKMEYMVSYSRWKPCTAENMHLPHDDIEDIGIDGIQIRVASAGYTPSSEPQIIAITRANPPRELGTEDATSGTNGKITGTTTAMEYSLEHEFSDEKANAISCMEGETTGLLPGYYYIRFKAQGTMQSSETAYKRIYSIKIDVPLPNAGSKIYTGALQTSGLTETPEYTVTTDAGGTNVGSYNVVLTLKNSATHQWTGGGSNPKTIQFTITKAAAVDLASAPTIKFAAETIATAATMEYKVGTGGWQACTADMQPKAFGWDGSTA